MKQKQETCLFLKTCTQFIFINNSNTIVIGAVLNGDKPDPDLCVKPSFQTELYVTSTFSEKHNSQLLGEFYVSEPEQIQGDTDLWLYSKFHPNSDFFSLILETKVFV
jgi:hypothetical protein